MKVTIKNVDIETFENIQIQWDVKIVSTKVLFELTNTRLTIQYYWNSHGTLVPWTYENRKTLTRSNVKVQLVEAKFTINDTTGIMSTWDLYINDEKFPLDILHYRIDIFGNVKVKAEVGCG